jgi:serine/threonine-protein kinase
LLGLRLFTGCVRATTVSESKTEQTDLNTLGLPPAPTVGTELGPYRLTALLGSGGMGMVFVGEHMMLGRRMAIKVLLPDLALRLDIIQRFFKEAKSANEIAHENIVEIFDFVQAPGGHAYLVMELLSGHDVGIAMANEGPFKLKRTLHIMRQVSSALAAAHAKNIVHRDLKPENIFLIRRAGDADFVKLLDFGLAKVSESMSGIPENTQAGVIMGTPEYMSPEQAMGVPVDVRSDVYSLAIVLYWMVTGQMPFEGNSFEQQRKARVTSPAPALPAVSAAGEPVPKELIALVARSLARPPEDRPQNCKEFLDALDKLPPLPDSPSLPPPAAKSPSIPPVASLDSSESQPDSEAPFYQRNRGRWIAAAAVLAVAGGIAGFVALQHPPPPVEPPHHHTVTVTQAQPTPIPTAPAAPTGDSVATGPAPPPPLPPAPPPQPEDPMVKSPRHPPAGKANNPPAHKPKPKTGHPKHPGGTKAPEPLLPFPE